MSSSENKSLVQNIFAELAQGNSKPFVDAMSDDFRWIVMGSTTWSRTFSGKQAVLTELLAPLRRQIADRIHTITQRFIAEDDYVVVEARGNNTTKSGKPYNNCYCFVIRLAGGKLKEITEYMDTALVTHVLQDQPPSTL